MSTYTVRYEETSVMYKDIEADSERDAMEKFDELGREGKIDFSCMAVLNTVMTANAR